MKNFAIEGTQEGLLYAVVLGERLFQLFHRLSESPGFTLITRLQDGRHLYADNHDLARLGLLIELRRNRYERNKRNY